MRLRKHACLRPEAEIRNWFCDRLLFGQSRHWATDQSRAAMCWSTDVQPKIKLNEAAPVFVPVLTGNFRRRAGLAAMLNFVTY